MHMILSWPRRTRLSLLGLCLWTLGTALPAQASVANGVEKWQAGQYGAAVALWQPYAARGDADALFNIGQAYKLGRGVVKDVKIAQSYYRRAAEKGHAPAATNLGILIAQGGNKAEAARWWRLAALRGEMRAQYMLGVMFFNGDTVARNVPLAHALMQSAARAGFEQAKSALDRMTPMLTAEVRKTSDELSARLAVGEENIIPGTSPLLVSRDNNVATSRSLTVNANSSSAPKAPAKSKSATAAATPAAKNATPPLANNNLAEAAVTAPVEKSSSGSGDWRVQIGAFTQKQAAETAWQSLRAANSKMLTGFNAFYEPHENIIRLQITGAKNRLAAKSLCDKLTAIGKSCFVIRSN